MNRQNFLGHVALAVALVLLAAFVGQMRRMQGDRHEGLLETARPNPEGVSMGHLHILAKNPDLHSKLWVQTLGATPVNIGPLKAARVPGVFIAFRQGEPGGGTDGSSAGTGPLPDTPDATVVDAASTTRARIRGPGRLGRTLLRCPVRDGPC